MTKRLAYVSLGPTCVPAEILKASCLRTCTYGFDWFRSGSFFVEEFLQLPLSTFLERYVMHPCIPLRQDQSNASNKLLNNTIELAPVKSCYGYSYLYNPHRILGSRETSEYFKRSFSRLREVWRDDSIVKRFVVADYVNKQHAIFLDNAPVVCNWFADLQQKYKFTGELYIVRLALEQSKMYSFKLDTDVFGGVLSVTRACISYWRELDCESQRGLVYRKIGRSLFGKFDRDKIWSPLR